MNQTIIWFFEGLWQQRIYIKDSIMIICHMSRMSFEKLKWGVLATKKKLTNPIWKRACYYLGSRFKILINGLFWESFNKIFTKKKGNKIDFFFS